MRCPEFKDIMRAFLDGEVDNATRKAAGLHLAECPDCARLIESDRFWDETLRSYLHHELPADLRADILGDLAHVPVSASGSAGDTGTAPGPANLDNLDNLGARDQWRIAWWVVKRDLRRPLTPPAHGGLCRGHAPGAGLRPPLARPHPDRRSRRALRPRRSHRADRRRPGRLRSAATRRPRTHRPTRLERAFALGGRPC